MQEGDFISLNDTTWSGDGLTRTTGSEVPWQSATPTGESGVTVTATLKDSDTSPSEDANDSDVDVTKRMYAYEALAFLNCTPDGSASVNETETVANGRKSVTLFSLYDTKTVTASGVDHKTGTINKSGNATWVLRVNPTIATLGTNGQLKTEIGADVNGTFDGHVYDDDVYDGTPSIFVGISASYVVGVSVGTPITWGGDEAEGIVGMGFGFASQDLGTDDQDKLELKSADFGDNIWFETYTSHGSRTVQFGYANTATLRGAIGKESGAIASVQGTVEAKTRDSGDDAKAVVTVGEVPDPNRPGTSMPAHARYTVAVPTYEPGTAPGPEPGY